MSTPAWLWSQPECIALVSARQALHARGFAPTGSNKAEMAPRCAGPRGWRRPERTSPCPGRSALPGAAQRSAVRLALLLRQHAAAPRLESSPARAADTCAAARPTAALRARTAPAARARRFASLPAASFPASPLPASEPRTRNMAALWSRAAPPAGQREVMAWPGRARDSRGCLQVRMGPTGFTALLTRVSISGWDERNPVALFQPRGRQPRCHRGPRSVWGCTAGARRVIAASRICAAGRCGAGRAAVAVRCSGRCARQQQARQAQPPSPQPCAHRDGSPAFLREGMRVSKSKEIEKRHSASFGSARSAHPPGRRPTCSRCWALRGALCVRAWHEAPLHRLHCRHCPAHKDGCV